MYQHKYIILLDVDEILIPKKVKDLNRMLKTFENNNLSHCFKSAMFPQAKSALETSGVKGLQIFHRLKRTRHVNAVAKCMFNTNSVEVLFNHFPSVVLDGKRDKNLVYVEPEIASVNHYRSRCYKEQKWFNCSKLIKDETIVKYEKEINQNIQNTMEKILI